MRPDLGVYDRINWDFVRWICSFRRRQRPEILELLRTFDGELVVLQSRRDVRRFLAAIRETASRLEARGGGDRPSEPHDGWRPLTDVQCDSATAE